MHERQTKMPGVNTIASHRWAETEAMVIAAQWRQMFTVWRCRVRKGPLNALERETIGHILSSCPEHVWGLIKTRHDKMLYQLTKEIVRTLPLSQRYIDQTIPTNRQIRERRPDIMVVDRS